MNAVKLAQKAVRMQRIPLKDIIDKNPRKTAQQILTAKAIREKIAKLIREEEIEETFAELKNTIQDGFNIEETKNEFENAFSETNNKEIRKLFLALIVELELNGFETELNQKEVATLVKEEDLETKYLAIWYKKIIRDRKDNCVPKTEVFDLIYEALFDQEIKIREIALAYLQTLKTSKHNHNKDLISLKIEEEKRENEQIMELR